MLKSITLHNFRNHQHFNINLNNAVCVITGDNGSGKTNILEALSFLVPGKGLRRASVLDISCLKSPDSGWGIHAEFADFSVRTGLQTGDKSRLVWIDDQKKPSTHLTHFIRMMWLTPWHDKLFYSGKSDIRKFFDHLVWCVFPHHAEHLVGYERLCSERLKILQTQSITSSWLSQVEQQIAEKAVVLYKNRHDFCNHLNDFVDKNDIFRQDMGWHCKIDNGDVIAENIELYSQKLQSLRSKDQMQKRSSWGVHQMNWTLWNKPKNCSAEFCSTGEQKIMLISLVLSMSVLLKQDKISPIILLDDICAHLDIHKRQHLFAILQQENIQVFLTGTEYFLFEALKNTHFIEL